MHSINLKIVLGYLRSSSIKILYKNFILFLVIPILGLFIYQNNNDEIDYDLVRKQHKENLETCKRYATKGGISMVYDIWNKKVEKINEILKVEIETDTDAYTDSMADFSKK